MGALEVGVYTALRRTHEDHNMRTGISSGRMPRDGSGAVIWACNLALVLGTDNFRWRIFAIIDSRCLKIPSPFFRPPAFLKIRRPRGGDKNASKNCRQILSAGVLAMLQKLSAQFIAKACSGF